MRTRSKYTIYPLIESTTTISGTQSVPAAHTTTQAWGPMSPGFSSLLMEEGVSTIIDDVSPSRKTKSVTHVTEEWKRSRITSHTDHSDSAVPSQFVTGNGLGCYEWSWGNLGHRLNASWFTPSYTRTINEQLRDAMERFSMVNKVDTLLNVVESSQLVSSGRGVFDFLLTIAKNGIDSRGRKAKVTLVKRGADLVGGFSSQYLGYSFGVAPLMSDIKKINIALITLKRDMDKFVRDYDRPNTETTKCKGELLLTPPTPLPTGYSNSHNPNDSSFWHVRKYVQSGPVRVVGVKGRRNVSYGSDAFKRLHYIVSRFVATGPASFAWERIPFSFVVDWFIDLSSIIGAMDNTLTGSYQTFTDGWWSEKWHVLAPAIRHKHSGYTTSTDGQQLALSEVKYYHREYLSPAITVGLSHRFGKKQASLTAALLGQMASNLRKYR